MDLLPCPFCASNDLETEDGGKFIQCKTPGCGGRQAFFRKAQWQERTVSTVDLRAAYSQFEASLKAQVEKNIRLERLVKEIYIQANYVDQGGGFWSDVCSWANRPTHLFHNVGTALLKLKEYVEEK